MGVKQLVPDKHVFKGLQLGVWVFFEFDLGTSFLDE